METPAQMCARLVIALEDLVSQEAVSLEARDFASVVEIQQRAEPLVRHLAEHAGDVTDSALRMRIEAIVHRRNETGAWLQAEIERTRTELSGLNASKRRVAQVAPAYRGPSAAPIGRLSVMG